MALIAASSFEDDKDFGRLRTTGAAADSDMGFGFDRINSGSDVRPSASRRCTCRPGECRHSRPRLCFERLISEQKGYPVMVDKREVKGGAKEAAGKAREATGDAVGNHEMEAKGKAQQTEGKTEKNAGKVKDAVKDQTS